MTPHREALRLYKSLHRTIQRVFNGDQAAMFAARDKVCEEFHKYRNVTNANATEGLLKQGWEVQTILAQTVVQLEQVKEEKSFKKRKNSTSNPESGIERILNKKTILSGDHRISNFYDSLNKDICTTL